MNYHQEKSPKQTPDLESGSRTVNITAILPELPNDDCLYTYRLSKTVRLLSIIDLFFGIFILFFGRVGYYVIFRLLFAGCGYFGAKYYDYCYSSMYQTYLFFGTITELVIIYIYDDMYRKGEIDHNTLIIGIIYQLLLFLLKGYITRFVCMFTNRIGHMEKECRRQLINYDSQPVQVIYW